MANYLPRTKRGGTPLELAAGTAALRYFRAAVVVPNGTLSGDGMFARIKEELLKEFNLHTIVRLLDGMLAPYTSIATNILFFDCSGPTRDVWHYEQPLPEGWKNYTKITPNEVVPARAPGFAATPLGLMKMMIRFPRVSLRSTLG